MTAESTAYADDIIKLALEEDLGPGDITTRMLFSKPFVVSAEIIAKENGVLCGLDAAERVFKLLDKRVVFHRKSHDGLALKKGRVICVVTGRVDAILAAERTALNFLGRLSGISALTRKYVDAVRPYKVRIMDTRKTTPGLRVLEKYAVKIGGGYNHRRGLYDQILVKDNHIRAFKVQGSRFKGKKSLTQLIERIRRKIKGRAKIEIEVENLRDLKEVIEAGPDIIMLDNMNLQNLRKAVKLIQRGRASIEASGGVNLKNVRAIACAGVDMISIGSLTHSAGSLDFSLEIL